MDEIKALISIIADFIFVFYENSHKICIGSGMVSLKLKLRESFLKKHKN